MISEKIKKYFLSFILKELENAASQDPNFDKSGLNKIKEILSQSNHSDETLEKVKDLPMQSIGRVLQMNPLAASREVSSLRRGVRFSPLHSRRKRRHIRGFKIKKLEKRKKYLHIALNSSLEEAREIISLLPVSDRILIEAGTPLIKIYGAEAVSQIKKMAPAGTYVVADNKCADLAAREVEIMASAGANAATCLGVAPIETIDRFVEECRKAGIDSMIDMMNVESAVSVLKKLKKLPDVVMLHRGVDESEFSKEKSIPFYQIKQIKGNYNLLVAVAGGDTVREVQRAVFNDADIVVVWKHFYQPSAETAQLAEAFLKEIK